MSNFTSCDINIQSEKTAKKLQKVKSSHQHSEAVLRLPFACGKDKESEGFYWSS